MQTMEKSTSLKDERMSRELVTIGYSLPARNPRPVLTTLTFPRLVQKQLLIGYMKGAGQMEVSMGDAIAVVNGGRSRYQNP